MDYIVDFSSYLNLISEGLIKTYDIDETIFHIKRNFSLHNFNFNVVKNLNNTFYIEIPDFNRLGDAPIVMDLILSNLIDLYGWFPSTMEMENIYGMTNTRKFDKSVIGFARKNISNIKITFESKFDLLTNIPSKMYHLSIKQYKDDILKNGIFPKSKSKLTRHDYDSRIYLSDTLISCKSIIPRMRLFYSDEKNNILYHRNNSKKYYNKNTDWIIFEIDSKDIDILYKDPNSSGYYFLGNIRPENIKVIEEE